MRRNKSRNGKNISREFTNVLDAPGFGSKLLDIDGFDKEMYERQRNVVFESIQGEKKSI